MNTQAPPRPDTGHDASANCEDAFDAVARRLDALLQSTTQAPPPAATDAQPTAATETPPSTTTPPPSASTAEPETLATPAPNSGEPAAPTVQESQTQHDAEPETDRANAIAMDTGQAAASVDTSQATDPATQTTAPAADATQAGEDLPDLPVPEESEVPGVAEETPASSAIQNSPAPAPALDAGPGLDPESGDPSALDLDAEIEALLAEQPIDPEVLNAASDIAQRDAEEAEQNKEALRLRAAEAAQLLEAIDEDTTPTEDDITSEIDSLLAAAEDTPIGPATSAQDDSAAPDPTIDQLDQMLAAEADDEDDLDLAGSFFSTDAIATGDTTGQGETLDLGDGLCGSFAANDSQDATPDVFPIDQADTHPAPEPGSDSEIDMDPPVAWWRRVDWHHVMEIAEELTRRVCWLINWPARRFLTAEWRATMGYLALLQVAGAAAVWLFLVIL